MQLYLLGKPDIRRDPPFPQISAKARALLYYLAVTRQAHSRNKLATLLWGEFLDDKALGNLRNMLTVQFRNTGLNDLMAVERESIKLAVIPDLYCDLADFEAILRKPSPSKEDLQHAFALYRGDFLEDFEAGNAPDFQEWVDHQRARLADAVERVSLTLAEHALQTEDSQLMLTCAERLLGWEPLHERAAYHKMMGLALNGERGEAINFYNQFATKYEEEFGNEPPDELRKLYAKLQGDRIKPIQRSTVTLSSSPTQVTRNVPPPFQVPPMVRHFVGREREMQMVCEYLLNGESPRVAALVGMGGTGKSTLANHIAHRLRQEFSDGVLWAHVSTSEPIDIINSWAKAYGYDFSSINDLENRAAALRGILANKRVLIILDDLLDLRELKQLLPGGDQSAVLITSRNEENAVLFGAYEIQLDVLPMEEGINLLRRLVGNQRVSAEETRVQEICRLLGNLPLALEITGQLLQLKNRMSLLTMAEKLANARQRLDLSIGSKANDQGSERGKHNIRTSILVSWEWLSEAQQRVFRHLAVFEGRSFTAEPVAALTESDLATAEELLLDLKVRSLVSEEGLDRYRQHALLSDFGREQLDAQHEVETAYSRMAVYYEAFVRNHPKEYMKLEPEWDNLMAGMHTAHGQQNWELVLRYANILKEPWMVRARYTQARQGLRLGIDAAQAMDDQTALTDYLIQQSFACIEQGDHLEGEDGLKKALELAKRVQAKPLIADAQFHLARRALERNELEDTDELLSDCLAIRQQSQDPVGVAAAMHLRAFAFYRNSGFDQAEQLCSQALAIQTDANDLRGIIATLRLLCDIACDRGNYTLAYDYCVRSKQLLENSSLVSEQAETYFLMAKVLRYQGLYDQAWKCTESARVLFEYVGNRSFLGATLYVQSLIKKLTGSFEEALQIALKNLAVLRELEDDFNSVYSLYHLGDLRIQMHDFESALLYWREAEALARIVHHPYLTKIEAAIYGLEK